MKCLAKMFVAVRTLRRKSLSEKVRRMEDRDNFFSGTALYSETRLSQLLQQKGGFKSQLVHDDPAYRGFAGAEKRFRHYLDDILPPKDKLVTNGNPGNLTIFFREIIK
jgi:hypothetical protein